MAHVLCAVTWFYVLFSSGELCLANVLQESERGSLNKCISVCFRLAKRVLLCLPFVFNGLPSLSRLNVWKTTREDTLSPRCFASSVVSFFLPEQA
ncbi:hypothetical protein ATANTOWER_013591 [Ataeniobius toweri]|uniref:Secreted protein n=1 Tax=Ataeniobius toweri TaxID=208326 RepID=A0ABU7AUI5_9TELE|nr:hypothetical protein [Ataeniobius toweri]